jgi:hypothetical protein
VGGSAVAYAQAALQEAGGGFAELDYQANGIVEKGIVIIIIVAGGNFSGIVVGTG